MLHKSVAMMIAVDARSNTPVGGRAEVDAFGAVSVAYVLHDALVFEAVVGAGAVDKQAAWAKALPSVANDFDVATGTFVHQGRRPLRHSLGVFAHHALAAARHVGSHHVE